MAPLTNVAPGTRFLVTAASLVVLMAGMREAGPLLLPLILSAFLATITAPVVLWLRDHRVPVLLGVPVIVLGVLGALGAIGALVGGSINAFIAALPNYRERLDSVITGVSTWLQAQGVELTASGLGRTVNPGAAMNLVGGTLSTLMGVLSDGLLVLLTMAFLLFEVAELPEKIRIAQDDPEADISGFSKVATDIKQYVVIKTYISIGTGLIVALFLWALGVDFPLLWGLFAFLLNYIPNIGSVLAAVPPVLLALLQFGVGRSLIVLGGFVAVNMVIGNVVEPALMGKRLGLSSLVVFLSLVFWGWLWGPLGMLLSVPLTMIVKILLEHSGQFRWVAVMMDQAPRPRLSLAPLSGRLSKPPPEDVGDAGED